MDTLRNLRIACAAIIVISFFLPWAALFGATFSGYKIVTIGGDILFLYPIVIVILSIVTILVELVYPPASYTQRYSLVAVLAGISPFIALLYGFSKIGDDIFRILSIGSYLTLISGVVLIIVGIKAK